MEFEKRNSKANLISYKLDTGGIIASARTKDNSAERNVVNSVFEATKKVMSSFMLKDEERAVMDAQDQWSDIRTKYDLQLSDPTIYSDEEKMKEVSTAYDMTKNQYDKNVSEMPIGATQMKKLQSFLNDSRNGLQNKKELQQMDYQLKKDQTNIAFKLGKISADVHYSYTQGTFGGFHNGDKRLPEWNELLNQSVRLRMVTPAEAKLKFSDQVGGLIYDSLIAVELEKIDMMGDVSNQTKINKLESIRAMFTDKKMMELTTKIGNNEKLDYADKDLIWESLQKKVVGIDSDISRLRGKLQSQFREIKDEEFDMMGKNEFDVTVRDGKLGEGYDGIRGKNAFMLNHDGKKSNLLWNEPEFLNAGAEELHDINSTVTRPVLYKSTIKDIESKLDLTGGQLNFGQIKFMLNTIGNDLGSQNALDLVPAIKQLALESELGIPSKIFYNVAKAKTQTEMLEVEEQIDHYNINIDIPTTTKAKARDEAVQLASKGGTPELFDELYKGNGIYKIVEDVSDSDPDSYQILNKTSLADGRGYEQDVQQFGKDKATWLENVKQVGKDYEDKEQGMSQFGMIDAVKGLVKGKYKPEKFRQPTSREAVTVNRWDMQEYMLDNGYVTKEWAKENSTEFTKISSDKANMFYEVLSNSPTDAENFNRLISVVAGKRLGKHFIGKNEVLPKDIQKAKLIYMENILMKNATPKYEVDNAYNEARHEEIQVSKQKAGLVSRNEYERKIQVATGGLGIDPDTAFRENRSENDWTQYRASLSNQIAPSYKVAPVIALAMDIIENNWGEIETSPTPRKSLIRHSIKARKRGWLNIIDLENATKNKSEAEELLRLIEELEPNMIGGV